MNLNDIFLKAGEHPSPDKGLCLMEAVALFAGEPHSTAPLCVCPVLTSHGIGLNDNMPDEQRQKLKRLIPLLVGTRSSAEVERRRALFLVDQAVRVFVPIAFDLVGLAELARLLKDLPEIVDTDSAAATATVVAAAATVAAKAATVAAKADAWAMLRAAAKAADAAARAATWSADAAARDVAAAAATAAAWAADAGWAAGVSQTEAGVWDLAIVTYERAIQITEIGPAPSIGRCGSRNGQPQ